MVQTSGHECLHAAGRNRRRGLKLVPVSCLEKCALRCPLLGQRGRAPPPACPPARLDEEGEQEEMGKGEGRAEGGTCSKAHERTEGSVRGEAKINIHVPASCSTASCACPSKTGKICAVGRTPAHTWEPNPNQTPPRSACVFCKESRATGGMSWSYMNRQPASSCNCSRSGPPSSLTSIQAKTSSQYDCRRRS